MLTESDVNWIKANRSEITAGRTRPLVIVRENTSSIDPYTGEPAIGESYQLTEAIWRELNTKSDWKYVGGIEIKDGDIEAVFDDLIDIERIKSIESDATIVYNAAMLGVANIQSLENGLRYRIVSVARKGLGGINRYVALLRRVT